MIRDVALEVQLKEQEKRQVEGVGVNEYQPGDLVFRKVSKMNGKVNKLTPTYLGPFKVIQTHKADVTCNWCCISIPHGSIKDGICYRRGSQRNCIG